MNLKKLFLATLSGGFGMWVIAGIWHNLIMAKLYESVHATHEGLGLLLVAYFILALLMSYIYPLGYKGGKPIWEGLRFGIVIGILWVFPHGLAMAGAHGDSISYVFKNAAWHMVEQGLGGIIIGLIYGRFKAVAEN
ncbi:MAG: hypothetical protein JRF49_07320 [Deltaproteobacteria bacterium]|nr:hypothetical protein [Deltaproteobacteria bacterium]MBW1854088.1 hypothetical protein [Deltaproteobacteria bacterium]MBW2183659.1 hypothetical protein [Deltaproteobacteria bacterium]